MALPSVAGCEVPEGMGGGNVLMALEWLPAVAVPPCSP
jgi:hypothetical protein